MENFITDSTRLQNLWLNLDKLFYYNKEAGYIFVELFVLQYYLWYEMNVLQGFTFLRMNFPLLTRKI